MPSRTNRLKIAASIGPLIFKQREDLLHAHEQGKKVAWTTGGGPFLPLLAMDIQYHHAPSYAAWTCGRKQNVELLRFCESAGYAIPLCSYEKVSDAAAIKIRDGIPQAEPVILPRPDFVFALSGCPNHTFWAENIGRILNVPVHVVEMPMIRSRRDYEENHDRYRAYIERQITEGSIPFLEKMTGRPFDYDRMAECVATLREVVKYRNRSLQLTKHVPAPCNFSEFGMSQAPVMALAGRPESLVYFEQFNKELEERIAQGIASVPGEKYRLYWGHIPVWYALGHLTELLAGYGAVVVCAAYTHGPGFPSDPEVFNPEEPIRALVNHLLGPGRNFGYEGQLNWLAETIRDYSIDGLIYHNHQTCKALDTGQMDTLRDLDRRLRIPSVIVDCDAVDPSFYNEAEWDTKIRALLETIDASRAARPRPLPQ